MTDNYTKIANDNLERLYRHLPDDLAARLPAQKQGQRFAFSAFGQACVISPDGITLDGAAAPGVVGILLSLYALNATTDAPILEPLKAFTQFPDSAPYVGAFASHTESLLVPAVARIRNCQDGIRRTFGGEAVPPSVSGDFAILIRPLPKISLCYIFYDADEDFPASVKCLFSSNANRFMPMDGLADVGEYTSRQILERIG
jgi:hypothetical protein